MKLGDKSKNSRDKLYLAVVQARGIVEDIDKELDHLIDLLKRPVEVVGERSDLEERRKLKKQFDELSDSIARMSSILVAHDELVEEVFDHESIEAIEAKKSIKTARRRFEDLIKKRNDVARIFRGHNT